MKPDISVRKVKSVLKGVSPGVCPLKAQLVDELLGVATPKAKLTKKLVAIRPPKLKGEIPSKSLYRLWAVS